MSISPTRSSLGERSRSRGPRTTYSARFGSALADAARTRRKQLDGLSSDETDEVTRAQRVALSQVLHEISAAQKRLIAGTFGACTRCTRTIPVERLEIRPWSATCVTCASR
jgi:DnaK suppressor protein